MNKPGPSHCAGAFAALLFFALPAQAQSDPARLARGTFREYLELLSLPNDSAAPADIQKNVEWLERAFQKRGFTTKRLADAGKPMLYADKLDMDLRVFARSSSDDKGPILMFLAAFDGLKEARLDPVVNVKVLLDSEEEKGSPSIPAVVKANRDLLAADAIVIHDGPRHASERPTLIFGNRGNSRVTLTVYGPKQPLHSGHYGNYVPNPAIRLARLIASMKDDQGRVTIPGYYDKVKLTAAEKKLLAATGDDEAAIRRRVGIRTAERVGSNLQEALQFPSLNVLGLAAASIGDKAANVIPHQAIAELDLRTTPETPPEYLFGLVQKHVEAQ